MKKMKVGDKISLTPLSLSSSKKWSWQQQGTYSSSFLVYEGKYKGYKKPEPDNFYPLHDEPDFELWQVIKNGKLQTNIKVYFKGEKRFADFGEYLPSPAKDLVRISLLFLSSYYGVITFPISNLDKTSIAFFDPSRAEIIESVSKFTMPNGFDRRNLHYIIQLRG